MLRVKAIDHTGRAMAVACGTAEQALEKAQDLTRRGYKDVVVVGQDGKELSMSAFERSLDGH